MAGEFECRKGCGRSLKSSGGRSSHERHCKYDPSVVEGLTAMEASLEVTIGELERMGRVEDVDTALIFLLRGIVKAIQVDPFNAAMWRQYREALADLIGTESALDDDELQAWLEGGSKVGDTKTS